LGNLIQLLTITAMLFGPANILGIVQGVEYSITYSTDDDSDDDTVNATCGLCCMGIIMAPLVAIVGILGFYVLMFVGVIVYIVLFLIVIPIRIYNDANGRGLKSPGLICLLMIISGPVGQIIYYIWVKNRRT
jgi:hypothetical protein